MKRISLSLLLLSVVLTSTAQPHYLIGLNNDTLIGRIMEVDKKFIVFTTETNESKKVPLTEISKAVKRGLDYPMLNGRLSMFPFIDNEKAGLFEVVESQGKSAADLFKIADDFLNSNTRNFSRQAEGSTVGSTYMLLSGRPKASSQILEMMYKNENPIKFSDPTSQKIIVRVINSYEGGGFGCVRQTFWEYDLTLKFRDGRYRMELTNYRYNHFNMSTGLKSQFYGWEDGGDCKSSGNIESLLNCTHCPNEFEQMYTYLIKDARTVMQLVREGIEKQATRKEDDW